MILQAAESKLRSNLERKVKNSTAYTMATVFNCITETESDGAYGRRQLRHREQVEIIPPGEAQDARTLHPCRKVLRLNIVS